MREMTAVLGLDGCKKGWIGTVLSTSSSPVVAFGGSHVALLPCVRVLTRHAGARPSASHPYACARGRAAIPWAHRGRSKRED